MSAPDLPGWLAGLNVGWTNAATLALMFLEGAGVPGVPGALPMLAQAGLLETGRTTFAEAAFWGVLGNWTGSLAGYAFGRHAARLLPPRWRAPLERDDVRDALQRWGGGLVVVSRTIGSLRTPVTWAAAPSGFPFRAFALYSLAGALVHVLVWQYLLWRFGALVLRRFESGAVWIALALALVAALGWWWRRRRAGVSSRGS